MNIINIQKDFIAEAYKEERVILCDISDRESNLIAIGNDKHLYFIPQCKCFVTVIDNNCNTESMQKTIKTLLHHETYEYLHNTNEIICRDKEKFMKLTGKKSTRYINMKFIKHLKIDSLNFRGVCGSVNEICPIIVEENGIEVALVFPVRFKEGE